MHFPSLSQLHCVLFTRKLTPLDHWALSFPVWITGVVYLLGIQPLTLLAPGPPWPVCAPQATHTPHCEIHPRPQADLAAAVNSARQGRLGFSTRLSFPPLWVLPCGPSVGISVGPSECSSHVSPAAPRSPLHPLSLVPWATRHAVLVIVMSAHTGP